MTAVIEILQSISDYRPDEKDYDQIWDDFQFQNNYFGLANRSRYMSDVKITYSLNDKTNINTQMNYRSKYITVDSNGNNILDDYDTFIDGYILCDVGLIYYIKPSQSFYLGVNNIFAFMNPVEISNIPGRIYSINFKTNLY